MSVLDESFSSADHVCMQSIAFTVLTIDLFVALHQQQTQNSKKMHSCMQLCMHSYMKYIRAYIQ